MNKIIIFLLVLIGAYSCQQNPKLETSENKDDYTNYVLLILKMNNQRIGVFRDRNVIISETWSYDQISENIPNENGEIETSFHTKNRKSQEIKISKQDRDSLFCYALQIIENPIEFLNYYNGESLTMTLISSENGLKRSCSFDTKRKERSAFSTPGNRMFKILSRKTIIANKW